MTLCTDNLQTAQFSHTIPKLDIGTTTGHIRGDGHRTSFTGMCNNLRFLLMELRIQNGMRNPLFSQTVTDFFRAFDGDCTNQNRLSLLMGLNNLFNNGIDLLSVCTEYKIIMIHTDNFLVWRDLDNIQTIDLTELFLFCQGSTGHAGCLVVFIKEVLQCDRCQRAALSLNFYTFFCFNRLMETI